VELYLVGIIIILITIGRHTIPILRNKFYFKKIEKEFNSSRLNIVEDNFKILTFDYINENSPEVRLFDHGININIVGDKSTFFEFEYQLSFNFKGQCYQVEHSAVLADNLTNSKIYVEYFNSQGNITYQASEDCRSFFDNYLILIRYMVLNKLAHEISKVTKSHRLTSHIVVGRHIEQLYEYLGTFAELNYLDV